jgi:8-oxo-dGTP pyrophosphatase MutT (NUDIX family)
VRVQYGALPYRFTPNAALEILLVTTRRTGRWIIPKGWPIKGLKPPNSAEREAFEEAGAVGTIGARSIGLFRYAKLEDSEVKVTCEVTVFPLLVARQQETWPEFEQRALKWVSPDEALSSIEEPELKALVERFAARAGRRAASAIVKRPARAKPKSAAKSASKESRRRRL